MLVDECIQGPCCCRAHLRSGISLGRGGARGHFVEKWPHAILPSVVFQAHAFTSSPSSPSTASRSSRVRASSAGRYSGGLGFWGWWWFGRAMLSSERELACPATLPQIPIPACLVCLVIVNSKHSRPPLFVTWWPKWPELAEGTSGASGCTRASRTPSCPGPRSRSMCSLLGAQFGSGSRQSRRS